MPSPEFTRPLHPLTASLEAVRAYNEHPDRNEEVGNAFRLVMRGLAAQQDLLEAGIPEEQISNTVSAVEATELDEACERNVGFADLQLGDAVRAVGLNVVDSGFGRIATRITDGALFSQTLTSMQPSDLSKNVEASLRSMLTSQAEGVSCQAVYRNQSELLQRYPRSEEVLENGWPHLSAYDNDATTEHSRTLLDSVGQWGNELLRLNAATDEVATVRALAQAEKDGTLPEYSLLHLMGAFTTNPEDLYNEFVGSWYEPGHWRPVHEVVDGLRANHPSAAYRSLGPLLARTIDAIIHPDPDYIARKKAEADAYLEQVRREDPEAAEMLREINNFPTGTTAEDQAFADAYTEFLVGEQEFYSKSL